MSGAVPDWLPDPILDATGAHYKAFSDVYTTSTTDDDRPSVLKSTRKVTEELQVWISIAGHNFFFQSTCPQGKFF